MRSWPSLTAEAVCLARALEQRRPSGERLVDDPYARLFLRRPARALVRLARLAGPGADAAEALEPGLVAAIAARSGWIDQRLESALPDVEQVLILGAGYDSRAWRYAGPAQGRLFVEIDHPSTAARKARCVARHDLIGGAMRITADLATTDLSQVLDDSPLRRGAPTIVIWEGVTMYLHAADVRSTLQALQRFVGAGSHLLLDLWSPYDAHPVLAAGEAAGRTGLALLGEPIRFALAPADVPAFLRDTGWSVQEHDDVASIARQQARRTAFPPLQVVHARPLPAPG